MARSDEAFPAPIRVERDNYRSSSIFPRSDFMPAIGRFRSRSKMGQGAAVAGRRMAQPVYPQVRKCPCVPALALRTRGRLTRCDKTSIHTVRQPSGTPAKRMPSATRSPSREISWIITSFVESATPAADGEASVKRSPAFTVALACSSSPRRAKTAAPPSNLLAHRWAPSRPRSKLRQMLRAAK
jgi:hypothetical protein